MVSFILAKKTSVAAGSLKKMQLVSQSNWLLSAFESSRLKTGTPPRIDGRSLNYAAMEIQQGDDEINGFSYLPVEKIEPNKQLPCYITYTNTEVMKP
jgi:tRNA U34 5-carboxymethylaminomethyl modifying enzyme MnmG/GidA